MRTIPMKIIFQSIKKCIIYCEFRKKYAHFLSRVNMFTLIAASCSGSLMNAGSCVRSCTSTIQPPALPACL